jgi:hypothetical protein
MAQPTLISTVLIQPQEVINGGFLNPSPTSSRFAANKLGSHIKWAETRHIVPVIGKDLYKTLEAEKGTTISNYNTAFGPLQDAFTTPAFEALWREHLLNYISYAVIFETLPFIHLQVATNGLLISDTEFNQAADLGDLKFLQDTILNNLEQQRKFVLDYLCENKASFPTFDAQANCENCGEGEEAKDESGKDFGIIWY